MNTIKFLELMLILCLVLGCFVGCAEQNNTSDNSQNTTASLNSDLPTDAEPEDDEGAASSGVPSDNTSSSDTSSETASGDNTSSEITSKPEENNGDEDQNTTVQPPERDPSKKETEQWYMVLVNPDNEISKDHIAAVDRATIDSSYSTGRESSKYLDSRVVEAFELMCKAAKADGIKIYSVSSYRTYAYQEQLFKNKIQRVMNSEGCSEEEATEIAATVVARPGTSEHHLGLAVDINSVETSFENTKAFEWLQEHAENYGFIMRYPKDKQDITKIIYEPWHYRYVGVEHAKEINRLGLCFEEYIEYLKEKESAAE